MGGTPKPPQMWNYPFGAQLVDKSDCCGYHPLHSGCCCSSYFLCCSDPSNCSCCCNDFCWSFQAHESPNLHYLIPALTSQNHPDGQFVGLSWVGSTVGAHLTCRKGLMGGSHGVALLLLTKSMLKENQFGSKVIKCNHSGHVGDSRDKRLICIGSSILTLLYIMTTCYIYFYSKKFVGSKYYLMIVLNCDSE